MLYTLMITKRLLEYRLCKGPLGNSRIPETFSLVTAQYTIPLQNITNTLQFYPGRAYDGCRTKVLMLAAITSPPVGFATFRMGKYIREHLEPNLPDVDLSGYCFPRFSTRMIKYPVHK
jgi:hypothetical protein